MPVKRTHREIIIFSIPDSKLFLVVVEREKLVGGIEILIIFAVAALDLAVVPGRIGLDELMLNTEFH